MRTKALLASCMLLACACAAKPSYGQSGASPEDGLYRVPLSVTRVWELSRRVSSMTEATVTRIVDGDTVVVSFDPSTGLGEKEKLRLIGVDTPETVDPRKPVERYGREASAFASDRLLGQPVRLAFERKTRDYYGRLLAYVFLEDGTCFNLAIIDEGYGFAYTKYPFPLMEEFREAERAARSKKRGLWG